MRHRYPLIHVAVASLLLILGSALLAPAYGQWWDVMPVEIDLEPESEDLTDFAPVTCTDGCGGVFVAWVRESQLAYGYLEMLLAHFDAAGILCPDMGIASVTPPVAVTETEFKIYGMVHDGNGGVIISFLFFGTHTSAGGSTSTAGPYVQRIDAAGNRRWGEVGVMVEDAGDLAYGEKS